MLNSLLVIMALSVSTPTAEEHKVCSQISSIVGSMAKLRDMGTPRSEALGYLYEMDLPKNLLDAGISITNTVYDSPLLTEAQMVDTTYTSCVKP